MDASRACRCRRALRNSCLMFGLWMHHKWFCLLRFWMEPLLVFVDELRVGADRRVRPRLSHCYCLANVMLNQCVFACAVDASRVCWASRIKCQCWLWIPCDFLLKQILRVGADRCACPSNEIPTTSNLPRSQPIAFQKWVIRLYFPSFRHQSEKL